MKKRLLLLLLCAVMLTAPLSACAHRHAYADAWSTTPEKHWKADTCEHGTKVQEGYHTFDKNFVCVVCGYAESNGALSVAQIINNPPTEETVVMQGLYVGVSDEGAGYDKEMLLKDQSSDRLIAVQGVPYGTFPYYGYEKGDLVRLSGTVVQELFDPQEKDSQNKTYLAFGEDNPAQIEGTILSRGNAVSYQLSDVATIDSWDAMKTFFDASSLSAYTYVHFKGNVWFNTYCKATDGVPLHRLSMRELASTLTATKPDGVRAVGFRQNTLEANLPATMTDYFDQYVGGTSFPGKKATVDFYAVLSAINGVNYQLTILDSSWLVGHEGQIKIETQQDIVREVGFAYYRQGTQIYYDQRYRDESPSPEDASAQQRLYLDCSSFVNAVYHEAFGVNIQRVPITERSPQTGNYTSYAKENLGTSADIVGYWETADYTTRETQKALLDAVLAQLQVGDVLVYRHGVTGPNSGHALLYIGDGMFLHSTGGQATVDSTNPNNSKDILDAMEMTHGTVQKIAASVLFSDVTSSRYLFRNDKSDKMFHFCVIRPLALGLTATEKTQNRMKLAGVTMEKLISPGIAAAVARGGEITYTLRIQNHSTNAYEGVLLEDTLSEHLSFVSGTEGLSVNDRKLSMTLSIAPMATATVYWTAKVKDTAPVGARIESNATALGGVKLLDTVNFVSAYTAEQLQAVAEKARSYSEAGAKFDDPLALARSIYKEALGVDILTDTTAATLMEALFPIPEEGNPALREDAPQAAMAVPRLHGGTLLHRISDIVAIHTEQDFMQGDLILCQWNGQYRLLVYVGEGQLVQIDTVTNTASLLDNGKDFATYHNKNYCIDSIFSQLRTYELCVVLRPAMPGA